MVPQPWLTAAFIADILVWETPQEIQFTDQSIWRPTTRWRDFGDGYFSSQQNPKHTYNIEWIYTVSLKITDALYKATEEKIDYIEITETTDGLENLDNISEARRGPRSFPPLPDDTVEPDWNVRVQWRWERSWGIIEENVLPLN